METYSVFKNHLHGGYFAVPSHEVLAYEEELEDIYGYCEQCGDCDDYLGEVDSEFEPSQEFLKNFASEQM